MVVQKQLFASGWLMLAVFNILLAASCIHGFQWPWSPKEDIKADKVSQPTTPDRIQNNSSRD
jgi:hypothetical protein